MELMRGGPGTVGHGGGLGWVLFWRQRSACGAKLCPEAVVPSERV